MLRERVVGACCGSKLPRVYRPLETHEVFDNHIEEAIITQDISKSVQRYQNAIEDTKTRLDLAVARGVWLMPSNMVKTRKALLAITIS